MDDLIQISKLNDFLYSPKSLYFHTAFEDLNTAIYHDTYQKIGKIKHETVDQSTYSTKKDLVQGISVYSEKYGLVGKIDLFDNDTKTLIERKTKIKEIHTGYKVQLWAQYLCMIEMGYNIQRLKLYSISDNKNYPIELPTAADLEFMENLFEKIRNYDPLEDFTNWKQEPIDKNTIYNTLYF
jgi:CRISPR-associated protein Cas4